MKLLFVCSQNKRRKENTGNTAILALCRVQKCAFLILCQRKEVGEWTSKK